MKRRLQINISVILLVILIITETAFLTINHITTDYQMNKNVEAAVQKAVLKVEYDEDDHEVEFDDVNLYVDNVMITIYNEQGEVVLGSPIIGLKSTHDFKNHETYTLDIDNNHYHVYDLKLTFGSESYWFKGIYDDSHHGSSLQNAFRSFLILLPVTGIVALLISILLVNRAFKPVNQLVSSADDIAKSGAFDQRLPVDEKHHDEIYELSSSLNEMLDQLETSLEREREFTADVSHEIKTPLSAILLECDNALLEEENIDDYKESITNIKNRTRQLMGMIEQLLQMSRSLSRQDVMNIDEFDLSLICEETIEQYRELYPDIIFDGDIEKDIQFGGDETLIMRMLINLLNNSVRYRRLDEPLKVNLSLKRKNGLELTISDNGMGIKKEDLSKIFLRFYQVDASHTASNSYGLGLSMVKWIVDAHDGQIEVESDYGQGTTFTIQLPIN